MNRHVILNIGAGKTDLQQLINYFNQNPKTRYFYVFLDRCYKEAHTITKIENMYTDWMNNFENIDNVTCFCNCDVFEFLDAYKFKFDEIRGYRIFEHMDYCSGEIGRLLEACNMITTDNGKLDIIVPNALKLADMLKKYDSSDSDNNIIKSMKQKLIINTEFVNFKLDPHASVWTPRLAREYIESEGTWIIKKIYSDFIYANRDIYMLILCNKKQISKIR